MPSKLSLYNGALAVLGEEKLASVTENRAPRRALDTVYDGDGIKTCLELGQWKFAMRTVQLTYSPSVDPDFGLQYAFDKPDDFVRTAGVCSDEFFLSPLGGNDYVDEAEYWFANIDTLYVRYVSDDAAYGMNLSRWPQNFVRYVENYFASRTCKIITGAEFTDKQMREMDRVLTQAQATDALAEGTKPIPHGSWTNARTGGYGRWSSGNTGGDR